MNHYYRILENIQNANQKKMFFSQADDDSDNSPHDLDYGGGSDLDYATVNISGSLGISSHQHIGQHAFAEMQVSLC